MMHNSAMAEAPILPSTPNSRLGIDNIHLSLSKTANVGEMWPSGIHLHAPPRGDVGISRYLDACWAAATKRAYAADMRDFLHWGGELPASAESVARYLADRASRLSPATLARRLAGIRSAHAVAGYPDPTRNPLVGMVLKGIRRTHGVAQRRALPLDPRTMRLAWSRSDDLRGKRDRALVLLGFYGAFRRSELVSLDVQSLSWSERGLTLRLEKSKTDQVQASRLVAVPWARDMPCACRAVKEWLAASEIAAGALFRSIERPGRLGDRLNPQSVNSIVKRLARLEGLPVNSVSGHSLRAGFVTAAVEAGTSLALIQRRTGHASLDTLAKYIRAIDPFGGSAKYGL